MSLPIDEIPDAQLLTNPYLALQKSGEIRPGAGEIRADTTMEFGAELLGGVTKLLNAQFASEDKASVNKGHSDANKMLYEAKRAAAEAPPWASQGIYDNAVLQYKESVTSDEGVSALARDDILAFVDKYSPSFQNGVITDSATRQAKIEGAALDELTDGYLESAMTFIRSDDPTGGTQAIATYNEMMEDAESRYLAGVGTTFLGKVQARTAWKNKVAEHTQTLVESMIATKNPAYKGQIEEILGNPDTPVKNWSTLERAHNVNISDWESKNRSGRQETLINILNVGSEQANRNVQIGSVQIGQIPSALEPAWDTVVAEVEASEGEITPKWAAEEARKSLISFAKNNFRDYSVAELTDMVKEAKNHPIFKGASIDWSDSTGVLQQVLNTKTRHTSETIRLAGESLTKIANSDVPLTTEIIQREVDRLLGDEELVYYKTDEGYVTYKDNQARLDAVAGVLTELANHPELEGKGKDDFDAVKDYVTNELKLGTKINAIVKGEKGAQATKTITRQATDNAIQAVQTLMVDTNRDGVADQALGFTGLMTPSLDASISRRVDEMFLAGDTLGGVQLLDDFGHSGQILQAHSDYFDTLLRSGTSDDLGKAFSFLRKMEVYDPEHINKIFGKSTFEGFGDSDTKETLANLFKHGGRQGQDLLQALIEKKPEYLGITKEYAQLMRGIGSGDTNVTTAFADGDGDVDTVRKTIDRLVGQDPDDGTMWTRTEQNKYSPIVGMLIAEHFGDRQPTPKEIETYITSQEFETGFLGLYEGAGLVFTGHGASNQIPQQAIVAAGLNDLQIDGLVEDAALNTVKIEPHPFIMSAMYYPHQDSGAAGVIGTMLAKVKEHREGAGGDLTNAFFINPENATDLTAHFWENGKNEGSTLVVVPTLFNGAVNGFVVAELAEDGTMQPWQHELANGGRISVEQDGNLMGSGLAQLQLDLLGSMSRTSINAPTSLRKRGVQMGDLIKMWLHSQYIDAQQAQQAQGQLTNAP